MAAPPPVPEAVRHRAACDQAVGIVRVGVPQYEEAPVGFASLFGCLEALLRAAIGLPGKTVRGGRMLSLPATERDDDRAPPVETRCPTTRLTTDGR
jgi:hypothetical protein